MSVNSKMTAIADKIRALLGITGTMGLDAMATNLETERANVANAYAVIENKGGTVPTSKVSGNLVSAINSIPEGVTVQTKSGSFKTRNGSATATCDFQPDAIEIYIRQDTGEDCCISAVFTDRNNVKYVCVLGDGDYPNGYCSVKRTNTGFTISSFNWYADDWSKKTDSNKTYSFYAVKYT